MKKIFRFFLIATIVVFCSFLVNFNSKIIIYYGNYKINTNLNFIAIIGLIVILTIFTIFSTYYLIKKPNKNKFLRKNVKIKNIYENYIKLITESFLFNLNGNKKLANVKLTKANNVLKNKDLTKLLKSQIFLNSNEYEDSINTINLLQNKLINIDYITNQIYLTKAIKNDNKEEIELYCNNILNMCKNDNKAILNLYYINKEKLNWKKCEELLKIIKKNKILTKNNLKLENEFIKVNINTKKL